MSDDEKLDEIAEKFLQSGNNFHVQVVKRFRDAGWTVRVSPYYLDSYSEKPREIDLIVEKEFQWTGMPIMHPFSIMVRLYVECKYLPSDTASMFWFDDKDNRLAKEVLISLGYFTEHSQFTSQHHYIASGAKVAKLFASEKKKNAEQEPFYKALSQCLNATIAMRQLDSIVPRPTYERAGTLHMPVIVVNSLENVYKVDFADDLQNGARPSKVEGPFLLEVTYAHRNERGGTTDEHFLVDVVSAEVLDDFFGVLEEDAWAFMNAVDYSKDQY